MTSILTQDDKVWPTTSYCEMSTKKRHWRLTGFADITTGKTSDSCFSLMWILYWYKNSILKNNTDSTGWFLYWFLVNYLANQYLHSENFTLGFTLFCAKKFVLVVRLKTTYCHFCIFFLNLSLIFWLASGSASIIRDIKYC